MLVEVTDEPQTRAEKVGWTNSGRLRMAPDFDVSPDDGQLLHFDANDIMFREGDAKTCVYRIETGAIAIFREDGDPLAAHLVLPGQFLGLGFLNDHAFTALVMAPSMVRVFSRETLQRMVERDASLKDQEDDATEREFDARRNVLTSEVPKNPLCRVAGFLVAVSELNAREGLDPYIVPGTVSCQVIAHYMAIDIDTLTGQLVELRSRRLIDLWEPDGLLILDLPGLETVANEGSLDASLGPEG